MPDALHMLCLKTYLHMLRFVGYFTYFVLKIFERIAKDQVLVYLSRHDLI